MRIGIHEISGRLFVAPMAGVTDRPFRALCRRLGAGYAVSEMVSSRRELWRSAKSVRRVDHAGERGPVAVQIAGVDAQEMADAARHHIDRGAQIIDINMGCPARKVCNRWAGSALMRDEAQALRIVRAVVAACRPHGVPVTLKMRTGWCRASRNAPAIARAAEAEGVALLVVHGRTREQGYGGAAEHDTVAAIKAEAGIPVVANGDIDGPERARDVLARTGADALMIGRAALGRPWLFGQIAHFLEHGRHAPPPATSDVARWLLEQLHAHYALYGEAAGTRSARKHIGWAVRALPGGPGLRAQVNALADSRAQLAAVAAYFEALAERHARLPEGAAEPGGNAP
ncbi:MAG: tRNA-dihydrouridine synthase [Pseudomonadota bacterium]|nr:tRNA dihydrouridine synthase DusB [Rubrivivax sp.]NLZ39712.1 tRNA dihydrouridine synthase DusB [Comamonadaceae bacterium]